MAKVDYSALKKCAKCKEEFPLTMFNKNKSKIDGLGTECRPCANAHSKKYHAENVETHKARMRERYRKDPEKHNREAKAWAQANRERLNELHRLSRLKDPDRWKEYSRRDWAKHNEKRRAAKKLYRANNPDRGAEHVRARQTRKMKAMPIWADRDKIREIYKECRRISAETGIKHHVDHYYPLVNDLVCGLHNEYNLRIIPAALNQSKGNSFPT